MSGTSAGNRSYNLAEALEGVASSLREDKDGLTIEELILRTGKGKEFLLDQLRILAAAGQLEVVRKKQMHILTGKLVPVPAWKFKPATAAKK